MQNQILTVYEGPISDIDTVGADYQIMHCTEPLCTCHLQYPFALLAFVGDQVFLLGKALTAVGALKALTEFRKKCGVGEEAWKFRFSEGFMWIFTIEKAQRKSVAKKKIHREDVIAVPPGLEFLFQNN